MKWTDNLAVHATDAQRTVFKLRSGGVFAVDHPLHVNEVGQPVAIVGGVLTALGNLEAATKALAEDETLSDVGRERKLEPIRVALREAVEKASQQVAFLNGEVGKMRAEVFAPPPIDKGDVVTALADQELRGLLRAATAQEARAELMHLVSSDPRWMAAVIRSPTPMPQFTEIAQRAWVEHAAQTHPEAARTVRHQEATEWAEGTLRQISQVLEPVLKPQQSLQQQMQAESARRNAATTAPTPITEAA
jgi:hypothetical protein